MAEDGRPSGVDFLIFGTFKQGKSVLASTAPGPVLVIDCERGSRFTPHRHITWDFQRAAPPAADGTWDVASAYVVTLADMDRVIQWLGSGRHPFKTVIVDSVSNWQMSAIDELYGDKQLEWGEWGRIFRTLRSKVMKLQQLKVHPSNPIDALVLIAMARTPEKGKMGPMLQGQLRDFLPYMVDVVGALDHVRGPGNTEVRRLFIARNAQYDTGERVGGCLGAHVDNPNIADMVAVVRKHMAATGPGGN